MEESNDIHVTITEFYNKLSASDNPRFAAVGEAGLALYKSGKTLQKAIEVASSNGGTVNSEPDTYLRKLELLRESCLDHAFDLGEMIAALKGL